MEELDEKIKALRKEAQKKDAEGAKLNRAKAAHQAAMETLQGKATDLIQAATMEQAGPDPLILLHFIYRHPDCCFLKAPFMQGYAVTLRLLPIGLLPHGFTICLLLPAGPTLTSALLSLDHYLAFALHSTQDGRYLSDRKAMHQKAAQRHRALRPV